MATTNKRKIWNQLERKRFLPHLKITPDNPLSPRDNLVFSALYWKERSVKSRFENYQAISQWTNLNPQAVSGSISSLLGKAIISEQEDCHGTYWEIDQVKPDWYFPASGKFEYQYYYFFPANRGTLTLYENLLISWAWHFLLYPPTVHQRPRSWKYLANAFGVKIPTLQKAAEGLARHRLLEVSFIGTTINLGLQMVLSERQLLFFRDQKEETASEVNVYALDEE